MSSREKVPHMHMYTIENYSLAHSHTLTYTKYMHAIDNRPITISQQ